MFRQFIAFILLLAFVASSFSKAVIVVDFYTNQDYIAKTLCENRDNPMMRCGGRCLLNKRLKKDADQDSNNPGQRADNKQEILFLDETAAALTSPAISCLETSYASFRSLQPVDRAAGIFHPPASSGSF